MFKKIYYLIRYRNILDKVAKGTDHSREESYRIIKKYKKAFIYIYGKQLFREILLNYRIHYMNNKSKIINDYVSVIHSKEKLHKSDIVMSVNLINKYRLSKHDSNFVYDVFRRYFGESFPNVLLKMKAEELASEQKKKR
jgi:hypothetical protein